MQYRRLGNTGAEVSALGFGTMRLPLNEDKTVDEERAIRLIRNGIDGGINYVDTAYFYHDGQSEPLIGKALLDGYRDKVYLATKSPVWCIEKEGDFERLLDEQLTKLQTNYIDFYLLHALNRERFEEKVVKFNLLDKLLQAKKAGKIKWIGFSFHDSYDLFEEIINYTDQWDFCQIQYNYIDIYEQAGRKGLKLAADKGLGVVIMEPLLGGKLANLSEHVLACFPGQKTAVEYALDFLWDQPEVSLLLSGMSDEQQVRDNLVYSDRSRIGMASAEEKASYERAKEMFDSMALINCTKCRYCMPCPFGLDIPELFAAYNLSASAGDEKAKSVYEGLLNKASECRKCKSCEKECPQQICISERMKDVADYFKS